MKLWWRKSGRHSAEIVSVL